MARNKFIAGFFLLIGVLACIVPGCDELITEVNEITTAGHPEADFSVNIDSGCVPLTVTFADESNGPRNRWLWNFGDGDTTSDTTPTHTYDSVGTYTVTLTIFDDALDGSDTEVKKRFIIVGQAIGGIAASDTLACTGTEIAFTPLDYGGITSWQWNFGDGSADSLAAVPTPTHVYDSIGVYSVTLTTNGGCGQTVLTDTNLVRIVPCPLAGFTADPHIGCRPLTVQFRDTSTAPPGEVIVTWRWDFGNGRQSSNQDDDIAYTTVDTFEVTLTVTSDGGGTATSFDTIIVYDSTSAAFSAISPTEACYLPSRQFQVGFNADSPGLVDSLIWKFGDGTILYDDPSPVHAYTVPGTYTVILEAYGCRTQTMTVPDMVVLSDSLQSVDFTISPDSGTVDTIFTFTDISPAAAVKYRSWNFGDGSAPTADSAATHQYDTAGTYIVKLSIFNDCDSLVTAKTVVVDSI